MATGDQKRRSEGDSPPSIEKQNQENAGEEDREKTGFKEQDEKTER